MSLALTSTTLSKGLIRDYLDRLVGELVRTESICIGVVGQRTVINEVLDDEQVPVFGRDMEGRIPKRLRLLVDVLAFAQEDPHGVEIPVFARPPDVLERFLAVVALA